MVTNLHWLRVAALAGSLAAVVASMSAVAAVERGGAAQSPGEAFSAWSPATSLETTAPFAHVSINTPALEGCPATSVDGRYLLFASNRGGAATGLDILISSRAQADEPWGSPASLAAPINTAANEFCPTPMPDGQTLLFVSTRPGGCGGGDIYFSTWMGGTQWSEPVNLGCEINSAGEEASPFLIIRDPNRWELYFSSTRAGGVLLEPAGQPVGDSDIYVSEIQPSGVFGRPSLVAGVNSEFDDSRPNVRGDDREIFFDSNRPGSAGIDIWSAVREQVSQAWTTPANVASVNSPANETRAYLSGDATILYLGSTRSDAEGASDLYLAKRTRVAGPR